RDWSSDVCSSDLRSALDRTPARPPGRTPVAAASTRSSALRLSKVSARRSATRALPTRWDVPPAEDNVEIIAAPRLRGVVRGVAQKALAPRVAKRHATA